MFEEIFIQHVLPIENDIVQHIIAENGCEEPRHGVVVGISLVKVGRLGEEEKRGKRVGVAVKLESLVVVHFDKLHLLCRSTPVGCQRFYSFS